MRLTGVNKIKMVFNGGEDFYRLEIPSNLFVLVIKTERNPAVHAGLIAGLLWVNLN